LRGHFEPGKGRGRGGRDKKRRGKKDGSDGQNIVGNKFMVAVVRIALAMTISVGNVRGGT